MGAIQMTVTLVFAVIAAFLVAEVQTNNRIQSRMDFYSTQPSFGAVWVEKDRNWGTEGLSHSAWQREVPQP